MYRLAYHSQVIYPSPAAHALQMINMTAALSEYMDETRLFVRGLMQDPLQVCSEYNVNCSKLRLWSVEATRWPSHFKNAPQNQYYNSAIALNLSMHPLWHGAHKNVFFVRGQRDFQYWGHIRRYLPWLKRWIFVYEAHDVQHSDFNTPEGRHTAQAIANYDLVLSITQQLDNDLKHLSKKHINSTVVPLSSGLPQLTQAPKVTISQNRVVVGYIGTVDKMRGVDDVLRSLRYLPNYIQLKIVGRIDGVQDGKKPEWLVELLEDNSIASKVYFHDPVPYSQVANVIDQCDIVVQPSGLNNHASRYANPLKLFDYLVRGKPIVIADVPAHRELVDNSQAIFYRTGNPNELAQAIMTLVKNPSKANSIAERAWMHGLQFTYEKRAERIMDLINKTAKAGT